MIQKVKDLMQTKEQIDGLSAKISELKKAAEESRVENELLRKELRESVKETVDISSKIKAEINAFKSMQEQMKKELYDFKLFKKELRDSVILNIEKEFSYVKEDMKKEINEFNQLKKVLEAKSGAIDALDLEIKKLTEAAKNIKASDFELIKYKGQIESYEREKNSLLRRVDGLQNIISRSRMGSGREHYSQNRNRQYKESQHQPKNLINNRLNLNNNNKSAGEVK